MLDSAQVIFHCRRIVDEARSTAPDLPLFDSLDFLDGGLLVRDIVKTWNDAKREENPLLKDFLLGLQDLESDYETRVAADPMIRYKPAHEVALAFHLSPAKVRYNCSANRTSKTQTGYSEHYFVVTGWHPYRSYRLPPAATFIIGVNFSQYCPGVFERKMILGEPGNPLSPMFPEEGKWFYHYDDRKHILTIACHTCANASRARACRHPKSTIQLFSDESSSGPDALQGAQYNLGHFDEHIGEEYFDEAMERLKSVPLSGMILTGTPLLGKGSWEYKRLTSLYLRGPRANTIPGTDKPYVSVHTITQIEAGIVPQEEIEASKLTMDPVEQEARLYGRPALDAKRSVFDRVALHELEGKIQSPAYGEVRPSDSQTAAQPKVFLGQPWRVPQYFNQQREGRLAIWELPKVGAQYIIGADGAAGLATGDFSCASVLEVPTFRLVAQLHGHIGPLDYAMDLARLGLLYNEALLAVERNSFGMATITRLRMELGYPNLFRELTDTTQAEFAADPVYGIDTNVRTKGQMVSCLAHVVKERQITIPCGETLEEMRAFGQEVTQSGLSVRIRGQGGAHDDRVMSLIFAVFVALTYPIYVPPKRSEVQALSDDDQRTWDGFHQNMRERERAKQGELW